MNTLTTLIRHALVTVVVVIGLMCIGVVPFPEPGTPAPPDPSAWTMQIRDFGPVCFYTWGPQLHAIVKRDHGLPPEAGCPGIVPFPGTLNGGGNEVDRQMGAPR